MLATLDNNITENMPKVEVSHINALEENIDYFNKD